jgi:hypothetical protein
MFKRTWIVTLVAVGLGLATAFYDRWAGQSDESPAMTLLLLLVSGGACAWLYPVKPWRWGVAVGIWLPAVNITARALGLSDHMHPDTYLARLMLLPVALAATLVGVYAVVWLRRLARSAARA